MQFCATHKMDGMEHLRRKHCSFCFTNYVWERRPDNAGDICVGCFELANPDHPLLIRRKIKENFLFDKLQEALPNRSFRWDKVVPNECKIRFRPDFYFTGVHRDAVIECDENGHRGYDTTCAQARQHGLVVANAFRPLYVYRLDPDLEPKAIVVTIKAGLAKCGPGWKNKFESLVEKVTQFLEWDVATPVTEDELLMTEVYI